MVKFSVNYDKKFMFFLHMSINRKNKLQQELYNIGIVESVHYSIKTNDKIDAGMDTVLQHYFEFAFKDRRLIMQVIDEMDIEYVRIIKDNGFEYDHSYEYVPKQVPYLS